MKLCVLSTSSSEGKIWPAVMAFAPVEDGSFILSTEKGNHKYQNLMQNNKAGLVIGFDFTEKNVQATGTAEILESGEEFDQKIEYFFSMNPQAAKFRSDKTVVIIFKPEFVKVTDLSTHPPKVDQFSFS